MKSLFTTKEAVLFAGVGVVAFICFAVFWGTIAYIALHFVAKLW